MFGRPGRAGLALTAVCRSDRWPGQGSVSCPSKFTPQQLCHLSDNGSLRPPSPRTTFLASIADDGRHRQLAVFERRSAIFPFGKPEGWCRGMRQVQLSVYQTFGQDRRLAAPMFTSHSGQASRPWRLPRESYARSSLLPAQNVFDNAIIQLSFTQMISVAKPVSSSKHSGRPRSRRRESRNSFFS